MKILGKQIDLIIFDLDGTLLDSTSCWADVDINFFASYGLSVPPDYGHKIAHMGLKKAAEYTRANYLPFRTEEEILKQWDDLARKEYEEKIPLKEGTKELLDAISNLGVPMAVATANSPYLYEPAIERLDIKKYFSLFLDPTHYEGGKDSSKLYDVIAEKYGLAHENVLVVEDSLQPLRAARSSGYLTIGVYDKNTTKDVELTKSSCDYFAYTLNDILLLIKEEN